MRYEITGTTVPCVEVSLVRGESMFTQAGGMCWMTEGLEMQSSTRGGVLKGLSRMFAGESMFQTSYSASRDGAKIAFASTLPGTIVPWTFSPGQSLICQKGAFLCAESGIDLEVTFTKRFAGGLLGGEGFILQKLSGHGTAFLEIDGDVVHKDLAAGERILVDTGNVVAFESSVSYSVETVKGITNVLFGGEGLFLTSLTGPGRVILQTMSFGAFVARIVSTLPTQK